MTEAIHGSDLALHAGRTKAPRAPRRADCADGADLAIKFAIRHCSLGQILVAASDKGVCFLALGDEAEPLLTDLQSRFPKAGLVGGDADFETLVARVVASVEAPARRFDFPLDLHGSGFQRRVWAALREIPPGATASYAQIAERIGEPRAIRAVAGACAANKIAVAIPCHRVLRSDGSLSGYRWGVERKRALLDREAGAKMPDCATF
jgi:AraC family transcriptional regulator, regulatory protein of adaptative response / methylated-DNA-[protein]-cysteine methyltransferase